MSENSKPQFLHMCPVLASSDVQRDVDWYEGKLGFKNVYDSSNYQVGPIDYAVLARENLFVHLQFQFIKDMNSTDLKIQVKNIEPLFEEYIAKNLISPDRIRRKTDWNTTEVGLFDLSGNRITFFEDL